MNNSLRILLASIFCLSLLTACAQEEAEETTVDTENEETVEEVEEVTELSVDKTTYMAGDDIVITYDIVETLESNAWIGLVPADAGETEAEADTVDLYYERFSDGMTGEKTYTAPSEAGEYEIRVYSSDSQGDLIARTSFTVEAAEEEEEETEEVVDDVLTLDKSSYVAGEDIVITFDIATEMESNAWIGIVPATAPRTEAEADMEDTYYERFSDGTTGEKTYTAPSEAGEYEIRVYSSDSQGEEVVVAPFTVTAQ